MADESSLLDLILALLRVGADKGLFKKLHQDGPKEYYVSRRRRRSCIAMVAIWRVRKAADHWFGHRPRPPCWADAPSMEYYADRGRYVQADYTARQRYYQHRYRKGALRRVVAQEHTGLLATEEKRGTGAEFHSIDPYRRSQRAHLHQYPGDGHRHRRPLQHAARLHSAHYGQLFAEDRPCRPCHGNGLDRFRRQPAAPRSVFYARPAEMLKGRVDPPGCWLDASAVLVRQYLAYCFDSATKVGELVELPRMPRPSSRTWRTQTGIFQR